MKKVILIIVTIAMLLSLCACDLSKNSEDKTTEITGKSTESETAREDEETYSAWKSAEYVDEFGDAIGGEYLQSQVITGIFSNTATSGSDLSVIVYYEPDFVHFDSPATIHSTKYDTIISFRLFEYGSVEATYYSYSDIELSFKTGGKTYSIELDGQEPNGDVFFVEDSWAHTNDEAVRETYPSRIFARALEQQEEIKYVITIDNSKYSFVIDTAGYADLLSDMKERYGYKY